MANSTLSSRADVLDEFLRKLRATDHSVDEDFHQTFAEAQQLLELSDAELANYLLVSRPTVNRWVRGRNLPHRAMRRPIVSWIEIQLTQRLKRLEVRPARPASGGSGRAWSGPAVIAAKSR